MLIWSDDLMGKRTSGQMLLWFNVPVVKCINGQKYKSRCQFSNNFMISAGYYGLDGLSNSTFKVMPLIDTTPVVVAGQTSTISSQTSAKDVELNYKPIGEEQYVRSGLLGFLGPGGLVFVCGSKDGLMTVTGRKHNADDIIATVLAVEPMRSEILVLKFSMTLIEISINRFIYRGRIAVFSIKVLRDERVCVIAEQRPDCSEEESFQWMSRVLQAVDSIHQVGIYCLALVPPNHLPKTPLGGIHLCEARRRFLEGSLHPANVLMCPHTCVTNLPKPRSIDQGMSIEKNKSFVGQIDHSFILFRFHLHSLFVEIY